jgi:hypothetical protein
MVDRHEEGGDTMSDREPVETINLDIYGHDPFPWSRPRARLEATGEANDTWFLGTTGPDGRPHAAGVGALWHEGQLYFTSGPGTRKSRNLAANPAASISVRLEGIDLVFEGVTTRVTDRPTLEAVVKRYSDDGWPVTVDGDALTAPFSAPSAGPPPWFLFRLDFDRVFGVATAEPHGATKWRFGS